MYLLEKKCLSTEDTLINEKKKELLKIRGKIYFLKILFSYLFFKNLIKDMYFESTPLFSPMYQLTVAALLSTAATATIAAAS